MKKNVLFTHGRFHLRLNMVETSYRIKETKKNNVTCNV